MGNPAEAAGSAVDERTAVPLPGTASGAVMAHMVAYIERTEREICATEDWRTCGSAGHYEALELLAELGA